MVMDFAVEVDPAGVIFVGHRLLAARAIDDRRPAMAESDMRVLEKPVAVRAAMRQGGGHRRDRLSRLGSEHIVPLHREQIPQTGVP